LTLLAEYVVAVHEGDIRKRDTIPTYSSSEKGGHARRIMRQYETLSKPNPNWLFSGSWLFDRPADAGALAVLRRLPFFKMSSPSGVLH